MAILSAWKMIASNYSLPEVKPRKEYSLEINIDERNYVYRRTDRASMADIIDIIDVIQGICDYV